eukprot:tig00020610_g11943.t1
MDVNTLPASASAAPFEAFEEEFKKALKDPRAKEHWHGNRATLLKLGYSDVSLEKLEPGERRAPDAARAPRWRKALVTSYTNPPQRVLLEQMELKEIPRNVFSTIRNPDPAQPFVFYQATRKVQPTPECRIDDFEKICIDAMNVAAAPLLPIAREASRRGTPLFFPPAADPGTEQRTPAKAAWVRLPPRVLDLRSGALGAGSGEPPAPILGRRDYFAFPRPPLPASLSRSHASPRPGWQGPATTHDAALVLATDEAGDAMQVVIGSDPDFVLNTLRDQQGRAAAEAFLYLKAEELSASERRDAVFIKVWPVVQQFLQANGWGKRLAAGRERAARLGITKVVGTEMRRRAGARRRGAVGGAAVAASSKAASISSAPHPYRPYLPRVTLGRAGMAAARGAPVEVGAGVEHGARPREEVLQEPATPLRLLT